MSGLRFTLSYEGADADQHAIDLYDVSQALIGFQRSLALTTHLLLNGEIITQAPSLRGARIYAEPAAPGSWKMTAVVAMLGAGMFKLGTLENNSPIGHLMFSLYDYVISESLGVHVDYNKSLGTLFDEAKAKKAELPSVKEHQADALIEKAHRAIIEMHRPIVKTETATHALLTGGATETGRPLKVKLSMETFEYIQETISADTPEMFEGRVSSYNSNTFKGRIYIARYGRPIAFELAPTARSPRNVQLVATSLFHSALKQYNEKGCKIHVLALQNSSKSGTLKSLTITQLNDSPLK
ncbi:MULTISPECIES: hypothetical protein [unclassified Caballeronia]|uniref:DUF7946 domain-containing protein n=1 Tax=unclassified Caballeronia TaxID=2646786 RepID=UPI001F47E6E9|nr:MULTISPECIES: hypothetical protein [unclassified Caballeronia]MCE4543266.1 hypothetical protein [Caballeronia sp. PC1]MCE4567679.1 hypothetical protein [Caballeronia sp. CLC5]